MVSNKELKFIHLFSLIIKDIFSEYQKNDKSFIVKASLSSINIQVFIYISSST